MDKYLADCSNPEGLTPEHSSAYDFVDSMTHEAIDDPRGYLWYGWALREAFLRGVEWARKKQSR